MSGQKIIREFKEALQQAKHAAASVREDNKGVPGLSAGRAGGPAALCPSGSEPSGRSSLTRVVELRMTPISDAMPSRDELLGEQTFLTYCEPTGTWDLAFYEAGWEMDDGFKLGVTHWMDISEMWPGVTAQVTEFMQGERRVSDGNPVGEDAKRLSCEAMPARSDEVGDAQLIERLSDRADYIRHKIGFDSGFTENSLLGIAETIDAAASSLSSYKQRVEELSRDNHYHARERDAYKARYIESLAARARLSSSLAEATADAARYQRLRILGCAPMGTDQLKNGTVLCFQSLDGFLDADMKAHPSRGEAALAALSKGGSDV